jgi:two-component system, NarL family, sensor histidine kinase UhpB
VWAFVYAPGFWLMVLSWSWTGFAAYALVADPPFGGEGRMVAFFAINTLIPVALLCFIDAWSRRPLRWLAPTLVVAWAAFCGFCLWAVGSLAMPAGYDLPAQVWTWASIGLGAAIVARLVWHFVTVAEPRHLEAAILSVVGVAVTMDGLSALFGWTIYAFLQDSAPLLLVAMTAAFLQRNFRLFQSSEQLNASLAARLAGREQELEASYAALRAQEAETAIQRERARIMRDMHDGMGGQLLSLLMLARDPDAPRAELEGLVEAAIADLRLLVDSLDTVGDDIEIALALFRERLGPRLSAAGVELDWPAQQITVARSFAAAEVLSVYRILQEAVSNALRHGHATRISVRQSVEAGQLLLAVSDNGRGMPEGARAGRGLVNMRRRAGELHGQLSIAPSADGTGTSVTLLVPLDGRADA